MIDSGSKYNLIDRESWERMKEGNVEMSNMKRGSDKVFTAYGAHRLEIKGTFEAEFESMRSDPNKSKELFYVMNEVGQILIGSITAKRLGLLSVAQINSIEASETKKEWKPLNKIRDILIEIPIDNSVPPVQQRYRRVPVALEEATNQKVEEMLARDIIERANEPTGWVSPMVVVPKPNGDVRICIDMRAANRAIERQHHAMPTLDEMLPHIGGGKVTDQLKLY